MLAPLIVMIYGGYTLAEIQALPAPAADLLAATDDGDGNWSRRIEVVRLHFASRRTATMTSTAY